MLKAWVDPMPDGTLPNSTIRTAILKVLDELPIDCSLEDRKAQLKRSGLGKTVMFLAKVSGGNQYLFSRFINKDASVVFHESRKWQLI